MKRIIGILVLVGIIVIIVVQLKSNKKIAENRVYTYDKETEIPVFAEVIGDSKSNKEKKYSGSFEAANELKISAETQGRITNIYVKEGQKVTKGQKLIKIDDALLQLKLKGVNTKISGLEKDLKRYKALTDDDVIQAVKLEKTELALEGSQTERSTILEQIRKTTIKAPFTGVITMQFCEIGGFAAPAMPLLEITNINQLKFTINVSENDIQFFKKDVKFKVVSDAFPNDKIDVSWLRTSSKGNFGNSFKVEFLVKNTSNKIKSKMFGNLYLSNQSNNDMIAISSKAIIGSEINPEVYLIKDGKAVRTSISISQRTQDQIIIKSGISKGDVIITGGFINIFDNANVTITNIDKTK